MKILIFLLVNKLIKKLRLYSLRGTHLGKYVKINSGTQIVDGFIGDYSYCGYDCNFLNVEIGKFCCISDNVIIGGAAHPMHFVSMSSVFLSHKDSSKIKLGNLDYFPKIKTIIGNDVWIGQGVFIKSGVNIGDGAIIATNSTVVKNVEPYTIYGGNPAKFIKKRFSDEKVEFLLKLQWWNWSKEEIFNNLEMLTSEAGLEQLMDKKERNQ